MTRENSLQQIVVKLSNSGITFLHDTKRDKIILNPLDKPDGMTWPTWQFNLKLVSYFNQDSFCICEEKLTNIRELHHALLTRRDVQGCSQEIKNLIHHTYNTFEICKNCHLYATRKHSAIYLANLYGKDNIIKWYNEFPMKTKIYRIEAYLEKLDG